MNSPTTIEGNPKEAKNCLTNALTKRTYDHFGNLLKETTEHSLETQKEYDALGRKTKLILPDESTISYTYDTYHLTQVTRNKAGQPLHTHTYDRYDQSHNLLAETHPVSIGQTTYSIDLLSRPVQKQNSILEEGISTFDPNGNLLGYTRESSLSPETHNFSYDPLNQLIHEEGSFNHHYTFNAHYDRLQKNNSSYETNPLHELLGTDTTENEYDWSGNLVLAKNPQLKTEYEYDGLERLIAIKTDTQIKRFCYDYFNRLLTQEIFTLQNGAWFLSHQEKYLYDNQNEIGAYPNELRILGQGKGAEIGATIAIEKQNTLYIPLHDLFGNIISLHDPHTGAPLESYRYSAFGEEKIFNPNGKEIPYSKLNNFWRFHSKRKIDNLVYYGKRFYNPEHGRWLTPDPKGFDEGPNLYQFNRNNPFLYVDLYGEDLIDFFAPFVPPSHYSFDPAEQIELNKAQFSAFTTALGRTFGDLIDQARFEFHSLGSPTLTNLNSQELIADQIETKIHQIFPYDRNDPGYQLSYSIARFGIEAGLFLLGPVAFEAFSSKGAMGATSWSSKNLCSETVAQFENSIYNSGVNFSKSSKPVNLPSSKKIKIDIEHILEGHVETGSKIRQGSNKTLFPKNLNSDQIKKMIEEAYRDGKKIKTRSGNVLVEGYSQGEKIHMWVNPKTKTIETAYPKK